LQIRQDDLAIEIKVFKKIEDIPRHEWDKVYPKTLEGYCFLKTLDETGFDQFEFRYILVYDNDSVIGAAPCFFMDFPLDGGVQGTAKKFTGVIRKLLPSFIDIKVLFCGLPMDRGEIGFTDGRGPDVVRALCNTMEEIAHEEKTKIIAFKDFDSRYLNMLEPLFKEGFFRIENLPTTGMKIDFADFESYISSLSPASRYDLRRKFRRIDGKIDIKLRISDRLTDEELPVIYGLYMQTVNKQELGFEVAPQEFFRSISENMPGQVKYFLWRIDGKLIAFTLCLISQNHFIDLYLGFDYSVAHKYHLYFIRMRDLIGWCINNGIKYYEMGVTNYEPKRRLDFDFIPLYIYARHKKMILNPVLRALSVFLSPGNFEPVLKKMRKEGTFPRF